MLETQRVFVDIIEQRSFSRAAVKNHITQSAVSQKIRNLERGLGLELILRGRGQLHLTDAGKIYFAACKEIVSRYDRAVSEILGLRNVVTGQVRIGTITSVGLHELPPYIKTFLKAYPDVELEVEYRTSQAIYDGIVDFSLDLGLVAYPTKHPQVLALPMRHDELLMITPPGHALSQFQTIGLQRLDRQPFIAFTSDIPTRKAVDRLLRESSVTVQIVHQFDNVETIKRAVEVGAGISIVPRATVKHELDSSSLIGTRLRGKGWNRPLAILHKKGYPVSAAAQKLIETLQRDVAAAEEHDATKQAPAR